MSKGALGLVADKRAAMSEIFRVLRPGGTLAFADITVDRPVPEETLHKVALWTDCTADGLPVAGWQQVVRDAGFVDRHVGPPVNRFRCARTDDPARALEVAARADPGISPPPRRHARSRLAAVNAKFDTGPPPTADENEVVIIGRAAGPC